MINSRHKGANSRVRSADTEFTQYAMSKILVCTLFGSPQITVGTEIVTKQLSPKVLALFAYLAVTKRRHARDVLADLLWSELSNEQARNNLRYVLSDLRQVVGDYLLITPQTIGFNDQAPHWIDVEQLHTTLTASPTEISLPELQSAVDLYQGEFLAGFTVRNAPVFEEWVIMQRQMVHGLVVQGLTRLADGYLSQQNYTAGLTATQQLLTLEPWHETAHRQQMKLLAVTGQRAAALAQFAVCQKALASEFGIKPHVATITLYDEIRAGKYDKETERQGEQTASPPLPVSPLLHNLPGQLTPLFGRDAEIAAIYTTLADPDYRLLTLVGEGGVGKTRLALAVAQSILDFGGGGVPSGTGAILDSDRYESSKNPKSKIPRRRLVCAVDKFERHPRSSR